MADKPNLKPDYSAIATTRDGRDITRGYVSPLQSLAPSDTILQLRGGGNYEIYRAVLRDDQVHATLAQRRLAVVSHEWEVEAGGPRRADKAAADFLRAQLAALDFDRLTDLMLYGRFYGYAVAECLWARDGAQVIAAEIRVRDRRRFAFDGAQRLRLRTNADYDPGELVPERKFWAFATGADHDDEPYGLGLAHWLYWPVFFKRNGIKFWLIFLEKFGQPTAKGTFPAGAGEADKKTLLAALEAISTDSGLIVPEGMLVELLEAARSGTADYTALYDRMDKAIAKVVLGQTMTTEAQATGLGSNQASVHDAVRMEAVKADADLVCASFNRSVAAWLTDWNFPNAAPPRVWRKLEEPEDLNQLAARDAKLATLGYRPTPERIKEVYGEGYEAVQTPPTGTRPVPEDGQPAGFAEAREPTVPERMAGQLQGTLNPAVSGWIEKIKQLVDSANSLEAVRDGLIDLYPDMALDDYASAMQQALAAAELAGRADILDQANGNS